MVFDNMVLEVAQKKKKNYFLIKQLGNNNANIKFNKEAEQLFTVCTLTSTLVGSCLPFPDQTNYVYILCHSYIGLVVAVFLCMVNKKVAICS